MNEWHWQKSVCWLVLLQAQYKREEIKMKQNEENKTEPEADEKERRDKLYLFCFWGQLLLENDLIYSLYLCVCIQQQKVSLWHPPLQLIEFVVQTQEPEARIMDVVKSDTIQADQVCRQVHTFSNKSTNQMIMPVKSFAISLRADCRWVHTEWT